MLGRKYKFKPARLDEKPGIQAIATTSYDLMPGEKHPAISRDYEYKRLGTLLLLAAIDLQTREAVLIVRDKHSSKEYIAFLKLLDENEEPIVFHWKYNLNDIDVSEEIIIDTLPVKKSS